MRKKLRAEKAQGISRLGVSVRAELVAYLDGLKAARGMRRRDEAIAAIIAEHQAMTQRK